jgi:hypothetical protein
VKTLPNLTNTDLSLWRLLFVIIPAMITGTILFVIICMGLVVWHTISWLISLPDGISIYSHRGADNDKRK